MYLIYGGTGAIGNAIARRLAADGETVHLVGRNARALEDVALATGGDFTEGDVMDEGTFERATRDASTGGALKGLVYAVGNIRLKPMHRLSADELDGDYRLNALGAFMAARAAREALVKGEGAALFFSTVAVDQGFANHASIAMAKGAVAAMVRTLAAEWAPKVRVNAIAPSLTVSEAGSGMGDRIASAPKIVDALSKAHPMRRLGQGEDMAAMAAALLAPGGWTTGQIIGIDGGRGTLRVGD